METLLHFKPSFPSALFGVERRQRGGVCNPNQTKLDCNLQTSKNTPQTRIAPGSKNAPPAATGREGSLRFWLSMVRLEGLSPSAIVCRVLKLHNSLIGESTSGPSGGGWLGSNLRRLIILGFWRRLRHQFEKLTPYHRGRDKQGVSIVLRKTGPLVARSA